MLDELISQIKQERYGLDLHGIFDIESFENFDIVTTCSASGLLVDRILSFKAEDDAIANVYSKLSGDGCTILVSSNGIAKPVIFLKQKMHEHTQLNNCFRLGVLLHELGHADDMIRGINYKSGQAIDLARAEAHAEVFCLRRLNSLKNPYAEIARNIFARRLAKMNGKNPLKTAIYNEVISQMSRKKIALWASKSVVSG